MTSSAAELISVPLSRMLPVTRAPSTRSFIRLRQRRKVDLPQPDGPIRAVTCRRGKAMLRLCRASELAIIEVEIFHFDDGIVDPDADGFAHVRFLLLQLKRTIRKAFLHSVAQPDGDAAHDTTISTSSRVVTKTIGLAASTLGDWKPMS
jgi:hypothetical protein